MAQPFGNRGGADLHSIRTNRVQSGCNGSWFKAELADIHSL